MTTTMYCFMDFHTNVSAQSIAEVAATPPRFLHPVTLHRQNILTFAQHQTL
ncbi:hypothetical protein [Sinomicrobium oceani]|uniref:hypothetical protein n=1 Tax=Sinomicrobium oceani TaxID=1150368 RepID=UPI00227C074E|nr:hypothetical protein [Sinomicrobium oceani]